MAAANLFHLKFISKPISFNQRIKSPGPKYTTSSCSIKGVPLITSRKILVIKDKTLFFDIRPIVIGMARGIAKSRVRKKTCSDTQEPLSITTIILRYLSEIKSKAPQKYYLPITEISFPNHFVDIFATVPSAAISFKIFSTSSRSSVYFFLKPMQYSSFAREFFTISNGSPVWAIE